MNPNDTLSDIRHTISILFKADPKSNSANYQLLTDSLIGSIEALDDWLSNNGSFPKDWLNKLPERLSDKEDI